MMLLSGGVYFEKKTREYNSGLYFCECISVWNSITDQYSANHKKQWTINVPMEC